MIEKVKSNPEMNYSPISSRCRSLCAGVHILESEELLPSELPPAYSKPLTLKLIDGNCNVCPNFCK